MSENSNFNNYLHFYFSSKYVELYNDMCLFSSTDLFISLFILYFFFIRSLSFWWSRAENQKGVNAVQQCSIKNEKDIYCHRLCTSDSTLLVLNRTLFNSDNTLLALNWHYLSTIMPQTLYSDSLLLVLNGTLFISDNTLLALI